MEKEKTTHFSIAWEIHGQRSLAGYSPKDCKELDMPERLSTHTHTHTHTHSEDIKFQQPSILRLTHEQQN